MALKLTRDAMLERKKSGIAENLRTKAKIERSKVTQAGKEAGIDVFAMSPYVDGYALLYIPRMPEFLNEKGGKEKWSVKVTTNALRQLGNGDTSKNYIGSVVNTTNVTGYEDYGISGRAEALHEYLSKAWEYKNTHDILTMVKMYGTDDNANISADAWDDIFKKGFAFMPIESDKDNGGNVSYWFPVVQIETVKKDGKYTSNPLLAPKLDENGQPITREVDGEQKAVMELKTSVKWFKASENQLEKFRKASSTLGLEDDDANFEGYLALLDYTDKPDAEESENSANISKTMKAAKDMAITFPSQGKWAKVIKSVQPLMKEWDETVRDDYNEYTIHTDVIETELKTDEEVEELLKKHYGDIDARIEQMKKQIELLLAKGSGVVKTKESAAKSALENFGSEDEDTLALEEGDDDSELDFTQD